MHGGRTGEDGGAVGSVGHHGAELHTGKAQAAVDDGHEYAGDHTGTRNLEGHALVIGNTQLVDGLGDDDAKGERREQVHGLIASQKALHGSASIVGGLRRGSGTQRRDHGSTNDQHDERNERGARNAAEHACDDARAQRERKRDDKEADGKHQARRAERDALGQQRHQHLEGRGARARNGQARADSQIHRRDKELAELGMHTAGKLARVPASATAIKPMTGRPMAAMRKPSMATGVAEPACSASSGGIIRLPAPKSIENRAIPTVTTWSERRPRGADEAMGPPFGRNKNGTGKRPIPQVYTL